MGHILFLIRMDFLQNQLTPEERRTALGFLHGLPDQDATNVNAVMRCVDGVANSYTSRDGFFSVYLIGGNVTKTGERPDIDLLTATNALPNSHSFTSDAIYGALDQCFSRKRILAKGRFPDQYNLGRTKGKILLRITPAFGRQIDFVYVRSMRDFFDEDCNERRRYEFSSEEEFCKRMWTSQETLFPS